MIKSIQLEETINICIELLLRKITVSSLTNKQLFEMLSITLEESFIIFDNKYSSQDAEVDSRWLWFLGKVISNIFWEKYSNQNITKNF